MAFFISKANKPNLQLQARSLNVFVFVFFPASFLIAYLILQIFIGKPMYLMELVMGQYSGRGPTALWAMNPSAKGVRLLSRFRLCH